MSDIRKALVKVLWEKFWWLDRQDAVVAIADAILAEFDVAPRGEDQWWESLVEAACDKGHRIFIDDGDGGVYACPVCRLSQVKAEAWDECEGCEAIARMIYSDPSDLTGPCSRHSHDCTPDGPPHLAREWAALSTQERAEAFAWFTRPLAVVGQGVTAEQRDEAILAATREVAKQAHPWPGDGLLHDVRPVEAADAAVRAALESLGVAVRRKGGGRP